MTDLHPPPPEPPPPPPAEGGGMSSGTKVLIGCGVLVLGAGMVMAALVFAGGLFVSRTVSDMAGGFETQARATEVARELEARHTFVAPRDRTVEPARARAFASATEEMWERLEPWMREMEARGERLRGREDLRGLADAWAGLQGLGQARIDMIEVLEDHDMPLSEYLWTGVQLFQGYAELDLAPEHRRAPPENVRLAREHQQLMARIVAERDQDAGPAAVLAMAWLFGSVEGIQAHGPTWEEIRRGMEQRPGAVR